MGSALLSRSGDAKAQALLSLSRAIDASHLSYCIKSGAVFRHQEKSHRFSDSSETTNDLPDDVVSDYDFPPAVTPLNLFLDPG